MNDKEKDNAEEKDIDMMFYSLVLSLQASAMQYLGKVMSPVTGKIERNLDAAKHSIDMLEMIQRKTAGNLADDEKQTLEHVLYELRINYVDEINRPSEEQPKKAPEKADKEKEEPKPGDENKSE